MSSTAAKQQILKTLVQRVVVTQHQLGDPTLAYLQS